MVEAFFALGQKKHFRKAGKHLRSVLAWQEGTSVFAASRLATPPDSVDCRRDLSAVSAPCFHIWGEVIHSGSGYKAVVYSPESGSY